MTSDTDAFKRFLDAINHRPYPGLTIFSRLAQQLHIWFSAEYSCTVAGMSLGFLVVMLLCAGIAFFPCGYQSGNHIHLLSWVGAAYILWLAAWKIATSPAADENVRPKPVG